MKSRIGSLIKKNALLTQNIIGTIGIKGLSILIGFLSTPAYLSFFSEQAVLGIWFTILSILNWIFTFDLGIGNGLRNNLVSAIEKKDYDDMKKQISSAYIILGLTSLVALIVGWLIIGQQNWNNILNVSPNVLNGDILIRTVRIVFSGIILQFWLKIITSIFNAMQKIVVVNSLGVITNIIILVFLLVGKADDISVNIINLAMVNFLAVILPLIITTIYAFTFILKEAKPSITSYDKNAAKKIISLGGSFFIIQLGFLIINSTNPILITTFYKAEDVVNYQIYYKFFGIATMVFTLFTQPVWSATSSAYVRGEIIWIKKAYKFLNSVAIVGGLSCFAVIPFLQTFFNIWLGNNNIIVSKSTALVFALFVSCEMLMYSSTCIANGINKLKLQFLLTIVAALLKVPITMFIASISNSWVNVLVSHILVILPVVILQPIALKKLLGNRRTEKQLEEKYI